VEWCEIITKMTEEELLLYVCIAYKDRLKEVLKRRVELAISLLEKGVVSVGLAAELAGMSLRDFLSELKRRGIKPYGCWESE